MGADSSYPDLPDGPDDLVRDELLDRYLAGQATAAEVAHVDAWRSRSPDNAAFVARLQQIQLVAPKEYQPDIARARQLVAREVGFVPGMTQGDATPVPANRLGGSGRTSNIGTGRRPAHWPMAIGLLAVLAIVAGGLFWGGSRTSSQPQRYHTAPGQRSTVRLADGSTMLLAPATSIAVTEQGIDVTGEAYFTVAPHPTRPFIVRTSNAVMRVLGTRFSVRHYPSDPRSRVVVEDGRVALSALPSSRATDTRTVLSSQMMAFVTDSGVTVTSGIATRVYTSWTQGTLIFDRVPLADVIDELVRAYGVNIRIADPMLAKQTMRLEVSVAEDPLSRVLDVIGTVTGAHYVRNGQVYVLSPGHTDSRTPQDVPKRHSFPQPEQQYGR